MQEIHDQTQMKYIARGLSAAAVIAAAVLTAAAVPALRTAMAAVLLLIVLALAVMVHRLVRTCDVIREENEKAREKLQQEASHDALTGLLNRGAYDLLMKNVDASHIALIILDVDHFKDVNDTYGHAVGDRVLKKVAEILKKSFRSVDLVCRYGGDEFVVIMTRVNSSMRELALNKADQVNERMQHPEDDLPPVTVSAGIAFSDRKDPKGDIFEDADTALYRVKRVGKGGGEVYE